MDEQPAAAPSRPRILVTGATGGIGAAIVASLCPDHEVIAAGRDQARLARVTGEHGATPLLLDLAAVEALAPALAGHGDLDGVVHCAGVQGTRDTDDLDPAFLTRVMAVNFQAPVEITRALLPGLRRRRGHVLFISSTAVLQLYPGWSAYAGSKMALRRYADTLRAEQGGRGVRVTTLYPGRTDTQMQRETHAAQGRVYDPETAMAPASVAHAVRCVLTAPRDALIEELTITPAAR